jgi:hypothetical protein
MSMSVREIAISRLQHSQAPLATRTGPTPGMGATAPAPPAVVAPAGAAAPKDRWYDSTAYKVAVWGSGVGAMALSYSKNQSIPWAIAHGFIGPVYLAYRGIQYAKQRR